jgi:hemoglobin
VNRTLALIIAASTLLAAPVLAGEAPAPVAATATTSTAAAADAPPEPNKGTPAENAGAKPFTGDGMWKAFHGREGVHRIVDHFIDRNLVDARIGETFKGHDPVKLKTLLEEQFCYLLNGPCTYTGRDMKTAHKDMGLQMSDFNRLVENLQKAMDQEHVAFADQNRFLAKLAPMERVTVER